MLIDKIKKAFSNRFVRNAGWMGSAELANRIFHLATTVTLARMFTAEDYGLMSVIYTTYGFATVLTHGNGMGAKIIQADAESALTIANTAYWLNWFLCVGVFVAQYAAAFLIAGFYGESQLTPLLCVAATTYLMLPLTMTSLAMIERENRLEVTALANVASSFVANIVTVVCALSGAGVWSIVWGMVISTPVWTLVSWFNHPWRPPQKLKLESTRQIIKFGGNLLGVEFLNKLKGNIDYLLVGRFLGVEALGVYFFACNAGSGISMSVLNSFGSAMFPYFCEARDDLFELRSRFFGSLKKTSLIVMPIVLLQATLAPLYVPIIFGDRWVPAIPIIVMVCLSAVPFPVFYAVGSLLNAVDKTRTNLLITMVSTGGFVILVLLTAPRGIMHVAAASLGLQWVSLLFYIWLIRHLFPKKSAITTV